MNLLAIDNKALLNNMQTRIRKQTHQQPASRRLHASTARLAALSGLLLCLLFSACGPSLTSATATNSHTQTVPTPVPTIDASLRNQGQSQLSAFQQWITLMQQYGGNVTSYQQQYESDQQALQAAHTPGSYNAALTTLNNHVAAIQMPAMKAESTHLQQQLNQQVASWGQQHPYHDDYNNATYQFGYEYGAAGIGGWVRDEVNSSQTMADYQQAIEDINMYLSNFQAMTQNADDFTPYDQPHKTDLLLMQHYGKMNRKVVVVSLHEQAMRVYDHGQLVKAFQITTGQPDKPSIPGVWWVEGKQSPTVFRSDEPRNSPYWYPDTPINYAMQYHSQGYFIHDSWWRADYGPGTNFPHQDPTGDIYSAQGSHGCVNMSKDDAAWLYGFVQLYTSIIIY